MRTAEPFAADEPWQNTLKPAGQPGPALTIVKNTLLARKQAIIVREGWLRAQLGNQGFRVIDVASEGDASFGDWGDAAKPPPAYPRRYWGLRGVIEALAVKSTATRIAG